MPASTGLDLFRFFTRLFILLYLVFAGLLGEASAEDHKSLELGKIPLTGCRKLEANGKNCAEPVRLSNPSPLDHIDLHKKLAPNSMIPCPEKVQLNYITGRVFKNEVRTVDLSEEVPKWLSLCFQAPAYRADEVWVHSVGNILEAFEKIRGDKQAGEALLKRLRDTYPHVWAEVKSFLPEWVKDVFLYRDNWNPRKRGAPEDAENDGILERPPFLLNTSQGLPAGSDSLPAGDQKIFQACAPIYAPLPDIFQAENDFLYYPFQAGSNYEEVYPINGSYFTGRDPAGFSFIIYDVAYKQKPLPLWNLNFMLRQFLHFEAGRWQMINHLRQGNMNYLRLRIFYDPILTTKGRVIGYVKTEWVDVDVKGLPEGDTDRQAGARGDVGNIKKMAEKRLRLTL